MFRSKKQKIIEAQDRVIDTLKREDNYLRQQIEYLRALLRDYDGRLCAAMLQPTHERIVEALRPLFMVAEARQREHSDKLGMALIQNMKQDPDKYLGPIEIDPVLLKALDHKHPVEK